jgi:dTDP-4-dehydrorhamnose reductase
MMRILILGGDGMLGHQLFKHLRKRHDVKVTLRQELIFYKKFNLFSTENAYAGVDVRDLDHFAEVINNYQPQAVINGVGIIKQRESAKAYIPSIEINALFPHYLANICKTINARVVHLSTDCVFSGKKGLYQENDPSDAEDLYGKSKFLGEVVERHCLTLRTSMIGKELWRKQSLLEWFLSQKGSIKGFTNAIFSGFTTLELSRIIEKMLIDHPNSSGIYHVSSDPISKYDLLMLVKKKIGFPIKISPDDSFRCDRSLDSTKFRKKFNYSPPSWDQMIDELCNDM